MGSAMLVQILVGRRCTNAKLDCRWTGTRKSPRGWWTLHLVLFRCRIYFAAKDDLDALADGLRRNLPRKASPTWEPPVELFRMALLPDVVQAPVEKHGLGYQGPPLAAPRFKHYLFRLLCTIRSCDEAPLEWYHAHAGFFPKPDNTQRVVGFVWRTG